MDKQKYRFNCYNCGHSWTKTFKGGFDDIRLAVKKYLRDLRCNNCYGDHVESNKVGG